MDIDYRHAVISDWDQLAELYGDFVDQPERYLAGGQDSFQAVLESQHSSIMVASADNRIVAFVCFSSRHVVRYPSAIVEVEEIFVSAQYRRSGIANQLMEKVHQYGKDIGADQVFLASDKTRPEAHSFYKSLGYDEYAYHYRRKG